MALRVCSTFRTTSDEAILVVADMIPVDIVAKEMTDVSCEMYGGECRKQIRVV